MGFVLDFGFWIGCFGCLGGVWLVLVYCFAFEFGWVGSILVLLVV